MELERITPEEAGISSRYVLDFLDDAKRHGLEIHSLMFLRHGKVYAESWWKPYCKDQPHSMFSFTKSLVSTAVGFAVQEGKMSLDDRIVDIFPDNLPEQPSENLKKVTIQHLLTMSCGHENEIPVLGMEDKDWIRSFLAHPFVFEPGTTFMYNTAGTNLVCAIIEKKTGEGFIEYLKPRLLEPLGMEDVPCLKLPDGTYMGGAGSKLTTEQMARFIQFVANKGTWEGKRLLNPEWFELACSKLVDNEITPCYSSPYADWKMGYGFQFWQCSPKNVFRADGAFGQFGVVCKDQDAVFILQTASTNFHITLKCIWDNILSHFEDKALPSDRKNYHRLANRLKNAEITAPMSHRNPYSEDALNGSIYAPVNKLCGDWTDLIGGAGVSAKRPYDGIIAPGSTEEFRSFKLEFSEFQASLTATIGESEQLLPISLDSSYNSFTLNGKTYGAVGTWRSADRFDFDVRCAQAATGKCYTMEFDDEGMSLSWLSTVPEFGGLNDWKEEPIRFRKVK